MNANELAEMKKLTSEIMKLIEKNIQQQAEIEGYHQQALKDSRWVSQLIKDVTILEKTVEEKQSEIDSLKANAKVLPNDVMQEYGVTSNMLNELSEAVTALKELLK